MRMKKLSFQKEVFFFAWILKTCKRVFWRKTHKNPTTTAMAHRFCQWFKNDELHQHWYQIGKRHSKTIVKQQEKLFISCNTEKPKMCQIFQLTDSQMDVFCNGNLADMNFAMTGIHWMKICYEEIFANMKIWWFDVIYLVSNTVTGPFTHWPFFQWYVFDFCWRMRFDILDKI